MTLAWNPLGAIGVLTGVVLCALAAFVWTAPAARAPNRWLGTYLFLHGLYFISYNGVRLFATDPQVAYALMVTGFGFAVALMDVAFVMFIATFDSPLASWMRRFGLAWIVAAPFALLGAHHILWPGAWITGVEPLPGFPGWSPVATPLLSFYILLVAAVLLLGTAPAVDAWRRARTPLGRQQAGILALSFVAYSASWLLFFLWHFVLRAGVVTPGTVAVAILWPGITALGFAAGLVYGIMKAQLFDIDLKIKWTLSKGTVAAVFVSVFFIVSEGAEAVLSAQLGPVAGLLAAGALVFALAPLMRAADRIADKAMPTVRNDEEYRLVRKREVYRAAVQSALEEGDISPKERGMLATLAESLAIGPKAMHDIEREARASHGDAVAEVPAGPTTTSITHR